ncbi:MAG: cell division protein FtsL [Acidobacteriales bacterium]|nr:cell division protein FtsL [Terriglobales bacterium]
MATMVVGGDITGIYSPARGMGRKPSLWNGATPEVFFAKRIDNSRVVKMADPQRAREIRLFSMAGALFFVVFLVYSWQHFRAIEYSYRIESQRTSRDRLLEDGRKLNLEQARLRDPERIDVIARRMGMVAPTPGQMVPLDPSAESQTVFARAISNQEFRIR